MSYPKKIPMLYGPCDGEEASVNEKMPVITIPRPSPLYATINNVTYAGAGMPTAYRPRKYNHVYALKLVWLRSVNDAVECYVYEGVKQV